MTRPWQARVAVGLLWLFGCGPRPLPPPPPAPVMASAGDFIPPDLDVVVRLDLAKVRDTLGSPALALLSREALASSGSGEDALLVSSLMDADVVWLAFRPGPGLAPLDRVLALQGRFEQLTAPPPGFSGATDLGADVRFWTRKSGNTRAARYDTARLYTVGERARVFVSEAEIDAVERALSGAGATRPLQPPAQGTLALAARPSVPSRLFGGDSLSDLFERADRLVLVLELESDEVSLKLELDLATNADAERLLLALDDVVTRQLSATPLAKSTKLTVQETRLTLRSSLGRGQMAGALACLREPTASRCSW